MRRDFLAIREESAETPAGLLRRAILARLTTLARPALTHRLRVRHAWAPETLAAKQRKSKRRRPPERAMGGLSEEHGTNFMPPIYARSADPDDSGRYPSYAERELMSRDIVSYSAEM
jgi:hypothetical protein